MEPPGECFRYLAQYTTIFFHVQQPNAEFLRCKLDKMILIMVKYRQLNIAVNRKSSSAKKDQRAETFGCKFRCFFAVKVRLGANIFESYK